MSCRQLVASAVAAAVGVGGGIVAVDCLLTSIREQPGQRLESVESTHIILLIMTIMTATIIIK